MKKGAVVVLVGLGLIFLGFLVFDAPRHEVEEAAPALQEEGEGAPPSLTPEKSAESDKIASALPAPAAPTPSEPSCEKEPPALVPGSKRVRVMPRKKKRDFAVDLDGDGQPERIVVTQQDATDAWAGGEAPGGPQGKVQVRGAANAEVLLQWTAPGYSLGVFASPVRLAAGRRVALVADSPVDNNDLVVHWVAADAQGAAQRGAFSGVPLELWDLAGDGLDAVTAMSQELYFDYIKRGTMDLLRWDGAGFKSLLSKPVFELCALDRGAGAPLVIVTVSRKGGVLRLLTWNSKRQRLDELQRVAVMPPDEGPRWNVPHGFALACSSPGEAPLSVQYRQRRFLLTEGNRLKEIAAAPQH